MNLQLFTVVVLTCVALVGGCSSIELPDDRASLLKLGDSTDLETSVRASQKLAELYGEPALIEALNTSRPTGRSWAVALLLGYPSSATRGALFVAAKDSSPDVRVQVDRIGRHMRRTMSSCSRGVSFGFRRQGAAVRRAVEV